MTLTDLPRDTLIHILRHAAADERNFHITATIRRSVCKDFAAAAEEWMETHDSETDDCRLLYIEGECPKGRRHDIAVSQIRVWQQNTDSILMNTLTTDQERRSMSRTYHTAECAAFNEFTASLFEVAWNDLRLARRGHASLDRGDHTWPSPENPENAAPFRMHLRHAALHAAVESIEADALHLLQASFMLSLIHI